MGGRVNLPNLKKMDKIKVLVVDDHSIMRDGIRALLSLYKDIEIVGEALDGKEAIEKTQELSPDVVLMDISMPHMNGIEATRWIAKHCSNVKIVIVTQYDNYEYLISSISSGASGYVPKVCCESDLVLAIRSVYRGELFLHPSMFTDLVRGYLHQIENEPQSNLTCRELEVLRLIAEGQTSRQIADNLVISHKTVLTIRANIMKKLGLHNQIDLFKYAIHEGLIKTDT